MSRSRRSPSLAILLASTLVACSISGRREGTAPEALRRWSEVDPRYVRPGPVPSATTRLRDIERGVEVYDVSLPSKAPVGAPHEALAPIEFRWWRPIAGGARVERRPLVVLSPILGSKTAFMADFAERFVKEGWHAAIVFRPEIAYDPERPIEQVEERLADAVMRRVEVLDWFVARSDVDRARIASFGISAGGIEGAMVAGADHRYVAHVLGLAGGPMADIFVDSEEASIRDVTKVAEKANGASREELRERLKGVIRTDPLLLAPEVSSESVLMILARHDHSVPTRTGTALRDALGRPKTIYLPLGHYASVVFLPFVKPRVLDFIRARFDGVRNATPP